MTLQDHDANAGNIDTDRIVLTPLGTATIVALRLRAQLAALAAADQAGVLELLTERELVGHLA